jgi:hypothetical protein
MPPVLANHSEWPVQLKFLIEEYGIERVWSAGIATLGFPPTWVHSTAEAERVLAALEK